MGETSPDKTDANASDSRPNSLLLTDWAAYRVTSRDSNTFLYELMLLSLLYDEILIQDEVLVLSAKLARWFADPDTFLDLRKLLETGAIVILKHHPDAYQADDLRAKAERYPIDARADYIERFSTRGSAPFKASTQQRRFYANLQAALRTTREAHRPVNLDREFPIMDVFAGILRYVLAADAYAPWSTSAYSGISQAMREDFVRFIDDPEAAVSGYSLRTKRQPQTVPDQFSRVVFNRSLAYQCADLYPSKEASAMKKLIQTSFAAPFCRRENALGRYGGYLRELIMTTDGLPPLDDAAFSVEDQVTIPVLLPGLVPNLGQIIRDVRNSDAGKALRLSMRDLGVDLAFRRQRDCWEGVVDEIVSRVESPIRISISAILAIVGKRLFWGGLVSGLWSVAEDREPAMEDTLERLGLGAVGTVASVAGDLVYGLLSEHARSQNVRRALEQAVSFRCTRVPLPVFVEHVLPDRYRQSAEPGSRTPYRLG